MQTNQIIPIFTSSFSLKSILQFKSNPDPRGADSISDIAKEYKLDKVVVLESNMVGFMEAKKALKDFHMIFGLRFNFIHDKENKKTSRICVFAKDSDGYFDLMRLYSESRTAHEGMEGLTEEQLNAVLNENLMLVIPFYDNFLHKNLNSFDNLSFPMDLNPSFFIEDSGLFLDPMVADIIENYAKEFNSSIYRAKSIFYKKKSDINSYVTYRCVTGRGGYGTKTLACPNIEGMASNRFCMEALMEDCAK